jgi:tryptophanyl-tRNA synthetase
MRAFSPRNERRNIKGAYSPGIMKKISLTGIQSTGDLHVGNYFGAIKPALDLAKEYDARYFIADYHALNSIKNPVELNSAIRKVATG